MMMTTLAVTSPPVVNIVGLENNIAKTMDQCLDALRANNFPTFPNPAEDGLWCNATWDTVLCWPATRANTSIRLPCPPLKGLDPTSFVTKLCDSSGHWAGKQAGVYDNPWGWTNFYPCMRINHSVMKTAQEVAKSARKLEFVGLGLSLVSLLFSIFIFAFFRRLRVFRNLLHLQLMIAILMVVVIRLVLYIDLIFTDRMGAVNTMPEGKTINTMMVVCESMFFLLEYFKTVAFAWMFLEGFHLHNQLVLTVFSSEPKIFNYMIAGYGIPLVHTVIWLAVVIFKKGGFGKVERCLGSYYLEPEFWILDGPRMAELVVNLFFICNVIRVLWTKVRESHNTSEVDRMKKSVKAALMLIPLLGIPNIMQTIPFTPTQTNIMYFAIWTYCASFTYMYQGFMITIIYCFTNKEVINVIKSTYGRYRLQHTSTNDLRRGSRAVTTHLMARNGSAVSSVNDKSKNSIQPTTMTVLTGSGCHSNGNGGGGGGGRPPDYRTVMAEMTPLKQKRRKNSSDDDEDYSSDESNHNRRDLPSVHFSNNRDTML